MDQEQERIQADLRGTLEGEVRCDDATCQLYASDASIYELRPLGVVRPRTTRDIVATLQYCHEHGISLHARGAGTGLAGESLGRGLVLDFSFSMRRILHTGETTVRVQPGVVHAQLNRYLASQGRIFGPDPATSEVTTMGSVLAIDGAGSYWLRYGSASRHVESLQIVLADGEVMEVGRESLSGFATSAESPRKRAIVDEVAALVEREKATIAAHQPRSLVNRSGYQLNGLVDNGQLNLARLIVGSEGTLGVITEATVRTQPLPAARGVALMFFDRLEAAAIAAQRIPAMGAVACDLMDRRMLTIARETDVRYDTLIPAAAEAMLLVEFHGERYDDVRGRLNELVAELQRREHIAFECRTALDPDDVALFWQLPRRVVPRLYRLRGSERPLPFIEDIAVPPSVLPEFLKRLQNVLKERQVTASLFAHAGHGQLHVRPFLDLMKPLHVELLHQLSIDIYTQVLDVGGTISGEHGDGLSRTPFVRQQYGPLYDVFREVKRIFDPHNILNPGKIVGDDPLLSRRDLRPASGDSSVPGDSISLSDSQSRVAKTVTEDRPVPAKLELLLDWNEIELAAAARTCNGCGECRTLSPNARMCPVFRAAPREEASPRAKANIMRGVITGRLPANSLAQDDVKAIADLCVHCHQCRLECPANVDVPRLMAEAKAQYVATNGLGLREWFLARLDGASAWGSLMHRLANWSLSNRQMRWLFERVLGIAQGRKLPKLASQSFLRLAQRKKWTRPTRRAGRKVLYFVDLYANHFDVQLAEAFVAVLEHNGASVYVHPAQVPAGMQLIAMGAADRARKLAAKNIRHLAEAIRQGYHVVATEPSATLCLQHEYPALLDSDDARLVAENTSEASTYLWKMHQSGKLELDLKPLSATLGYHLPCHLRALDVGSPGENLLRLVPGLTVRRIEEGCSGMAGFYGLCRENYRSSLRAGWGLISALRDSEIQLGATECSTCKMQMEQGTTKPTIHPIKVLALAYGLKPQLADLLHTRGEELVVT